MFITIESPIKKPEIKSIAAASGLKRKPNILADSKLLAWFMIRLIDKHNIPRPSKTYPIFVFFCSDRFSAYIFLNNIIASI